jgi:hypothetical protein
MPTLIDKSPRDAETSGGVTPELEVPMQTDSRKPRVPATSGISY